MFFNPPMPAKHAKLPRLFGQIVRRRRTEAGLSQEELAHRAGVTRNYVGMVERGEASPTILVARELAIAVGSTFADLAAEFDRLLAPRPAPRGDEGARRPTPDRA